MAFPREVIVKYICRRCGEQDYGVAFTDASKPSPIPIRCVCGEQCVGEICNPLHRQANTDEGSLRKS